MFKGEILYSGELKGLDERFTLFCLPAGTELDRNGYLALVKETGAVKVLTDDKNAMEKLGKIGSAKEEKVDLEVFFSLLVRGNKNAL